MKKEILEIANAKENKRITLNEIVTLKKLYFKDVCGKLQDNLYISFKNPTGRVFFHEAKIKSRDYEKIVKAIKVNYKKFCKKWLEEELRKIDGGCINFKEIF